MTDRFYGLFRRRANAVRLWCVKLGKLCRGKRRAARGAAKNFVPAPDYRRFAGQAADAIGNDR
jgi:hypothetical protein